MVGSAMVRAGSESSSLLVEDLGGAVEAGDGFGELRADGNELDDGNSHEGEEHDVGHVAAGGELSRDDTMRAEVHDEGTDDAEDSGRGERHERLRSKRGDDVVEKSLGTGGEDVGLALLGVIALDDADAAEGFGEAAGNFGIDLGALAEDGTDGLEGTLQDETEDRAER